MMMNEEGDYVRHLYVHTQVFIAVKSASLFSQKKLLNLWNENRYSSPVFVVIEELEAFF